MRIYADSSALIKRTVDEPESDSLIAFLTDCVHSGDTIVSSSLTWVDVTRALRARLDHEHPATIAELTEDALSGVAEYAIDAKVVALARRVGPPVLRTLDALHLASAILTDADLMVVYDERLATVTEDLGIRVFSPLP